MTDGGSRRIRKELAKTAEGTVYHFDYSTQEAVILKRSTVITLAEYVAREQE